MLRKVAENAKAREQELPWGGKGNHAQDGMQAGGKRKPARFNFGEAWVGQTNSDPPRGV